MSPTVRLLVMLIALAVAVPVVPWLLVGTRLDHAVAAWLDPPPPPAILAAAEVGVLAADILLPVPSSLVTTLGGASLGIAMGTLCGWLGMTAGSFAGWSLGRITGGRALARLDGQDRVALAARQRRYGPLLVVATRPLPILAEAAALVAGATGMPARVFLAAAAASNLAIAFAWSLAGALGRDADSLQWVVVGSLAVPALVAAVIAARRPRDGGLAAG
ncbi:MAG: VTT domain-containing protein [Pirellulales bacterium]